MGGSAILRDCNQNRVPEADRCCGRFDTFDCADNAFGSGGEWDIGFFDGRDRVVNGRHFRQFGLWREILLPF